MRAQGRMVRVRGAPWQCRALQPAEGDCEAVPRRTLCTEAFQAAARPASGGVFSKA